MKQSSWFFHPILIFIYSILALGMSLFLFINWSLTVSSGINELILKLNISRDQATAPETWLQILTMSLLFGVILMGIIVIFVYNQKTFQLYRLQNNFINNFTHELKTPVTSLKLYLETFIMHEIPREDQLRYIGYMILDVNRLSENINSILSVAKIETKSYGGDYEKTDLYKFITDFYQLNKHLFINTKVSVTKPQTNIEYPINQSLFEMLLMNIITNAIKYNSNKEPSVEIEFICKKRKLFIYFKDNGIGIKRSYLKTIFKKFFQIREAKQLAAKGSGLGLYLVQHVARLHKGKMVAHSDGEGKGSVFTLILPFKNSVSHGAP